MMFPARLEYSKYVFEGSEVQPKKSGAAVRGAGKTISALGDDPAAGRGTPGEMLPRRLGRLRGRLPRHLDAAAPYGTHGTRIWHRRVPLGAAAAPGRNQFN